MQSGFTDTCAVTRSVVSSVDMSATKPLRGKIVLF